MSVLGRDVNILLRKIQNGDENSRTVLYEKTYNHLKVVVYPYLRNKNDVEDVLMDAYLRIFQYISTFNPKQDGYNWMCKILQNVAYDYNKRYKPELPLEDIFNYASPVDIEARLESQDELREWLKDYTPRDKEIFYKYYFEGWTIVDLAHGLEMSKSNVHKRITKIEKEMTRKMRKRVEK